MMPGTPWPSLLSWPSLLLLPALLWPPCRALGPEEVVLNIEKLANMELHFITDFTSPEMDRLAPQLASSSVPVSSHSLASLLATHRDRKVDKCPLFSAGHGAEGDDHGDGHGDGHGDMEDDHDEEGNMIWDLPLYIEGGQTMAEVQDENDNFYTIAKENPYSFAKPSMEYFYMKRDKEKKEVIPKSRLHKRKTLIPMGKYHKMYVIWLDQDSIESLLRMFSETVMFCQQRIEQGIYDPNDSFLFIVESDATRDIIFSDPYMTKHSKVAVMRRIAGSRDRFLGFTHDFFHKASGGPPSLARWIWRPNTPLTEYNQVWTSLDDFHGHEFHVGVLPWSHHVMGDKVEAPPNTSATYENYSGYEIELLKSIASSLKFTYKFDNVKDGKWGHIEADATWSGMVAQVSWGEVDFVICDMFLTYSRVKMFDPSLSFDKDYMVFVAPNPGQNPKYLALVRPFDSLVWSLVLSSIVLLTLVFLVVSKLEEKIASIDLKFWSSSGAAAWYVYGTLIGESITRDTKSAGALAVRVMVGVWILYCLILTSAYTGNLKAFLTNPGYTTPIDTLEDVLGSGLPWGMVLYGEEEEELMANSPIGSTVRTIWDGMNVMPYSPTVAEVDNVYEGKSVFIDWKSGLEPAIYSRFSTGDGDPLVHLASNPVFMPNFPGWAFFKFNPWRAKFDELIQTHIQAGLVNEWKWRNWVTQHEKAVKDKTVIAYVEPPITASLTLDDIQSALAMIVLGGLFSLLTLLGELLARGLCGTQDEARKATHTPRPTGAQNSPARDWN